MSHDHAMHGDTHKHERLEEPQRLRELNPEETLARLELQDSETVCDIGAGTGVFSMAAARLTRGAVYALDTDEAMLQVIRDKSAREGLDNLKAIRVESAGGRFELPDASIDLALIVAVLHEIDDKPAFLDEAKRVLKADGRIAVIEFHARPTPFGPPPEMRLAPEAVEQHLRALGMDVTEQFDLGDNFYCMVFSMQST